MLICRPVFKQSSNKFNFCYLGLGAYKQSEINVCYKRCAFYKQGLRSVLKLWTKFFLLRFMVKHKMKAKDLSRKNKVRKLTAQTEKMR